MGRLYYYGEEMEQIQFVQMPNELIFGEEFVDLSSDAKILYCVLRNRMSLSARNNWKDEEGKVYVIYSIEEIMREFRCSKASAIRLLDERIPKWNRVVGKEETGIWKTKPSVCKELSDNKKDDPGRINGRRFVKTRSRNPCRRGRKGNLPKLQPEREYSKGTKRRC